MGRNKISVVMATYNGAKFLRPQLESIIHQTHEVSEFIVGDDCSTDQTSDILTEYAHKGVLRWYGNEEQLGVAANFRTAAARADVENYIAFADQDDVWGKDKLALSLTRLQEIEQPDLPAMVYSNLQIIDEQGILTGTSLWQVLGADGYPHTLNTILFGSPVSGCTMLMNPALARYVETIPDHYTIIHDEWLTLCAFTFGHAAIVPDPVISYRQHAGNVTFSTGHTVPGRMKRIMTEVVKALKSSDDLFARQFIVVRKFYEVFSEKMSADKRQLFEAFLSLEQAGYLRKKRAFRRMVKG